MSEIEEFDPDLLAAFIDGKLSGAEKERVLRLLAQSEAAFEVYSDAVMARSDLQSAGPAPVVDGERRPRRWWIAAVPAAAAAALLLAILPRLNTGRQAVGLDLPAESIVVAMVSSPSARPAAPLVGQMDAPTSRAALGAALVQARRELSEGTLRGASPGLADSNSAMRLGVRATNLQVALALGDREQASQIVSEIVDLLRPMNLVDKSQADYSQLRDRIVAGDSIDQVSDAASRADQNLSGLLSSRWFGFGKWFAAAELAARARSKSFFASRRTREFLASTIASGSLAPEDLAVLRQVAALGPDLSDADFDRIRGVFAELVRRHGG